MPLRTACSPLYCRWGAPATNGAPIHHSRAANTRPTRPGTVTRSRDRLPDELSAFNAADPGFMSASTGAVSTGPIELLIEPSVHHKAAPSTVTAARTGASPGLNQIPVNRLVPPLAPSMKSSRLSLSPVYRYCCVTCWTFRASGAPRCGLPRVTMPPSARLVLS